MQFAQHALLLATLPGLIALAGVLVALHVNIEGYAVHSCDVWAFCCSLARVEQCFRWAAMHLRLLAVPTLMLAPAKVLRATGTQQCSCSMPGACPPVPIWPSPQKVSLKPARREICLLMCRCPDTLVQ